MPDDEQFAIAILTTGGTIDKTYDETDGSLRNVRSVLEKILEQLRLPELRVTHVPVMSKDSLEMTPEDRQTILEAVQRAASDHDAVLVIHGTDTLTETGAHLHAHISSPPVPVLMTGAFRPWEFRDTDALQNVTESLFAARILPPGIYAVFHGRALGFPGVFKNRHSRTFSRRES